MHDRSFMWFLCIVVCFLYPVDGGTTCLSCSGVESVIDCTHLERCGNNEICFAHKYVTESKSELYDFGCTYQKLCVPGSSGSVFGRALSEGHHIVCQTCCNDTDICNMKSSCVSNVANSSSTQHGTNSTLPKECDDLTNTTTGVYTIYPDGIRPTQVYCIMTKNEKWTVIQRRFNGFVDFYQDWINYKNGFGPAAGEYWLADRLIYHNGMKFTTKDEDNSLSNCGLGDHGGWWYYSCALVNLNGPYLAGPTNTEASMFWNGWPQSHYSLKKSTMMIKRIK